VSRPKGRVARAPRPARRVWPPESRETARDAIERLLRERGLARRFEKPLERQAERMRDRGLDAHADLAARRDLRALATFTIDPASARDFDDAISAERLPDADGGVRIWVHIADVCAYAPEGSAIDAEAQRRSTSVYVPGAVEPMLPRALSNEACSLLPGHDRLAVTVELDLRGAEVTRTAFHRSLIRSDARLDYEQVDRIFAGAERAQEPWAEPLAAARAAAAALGEARRRHAGALTLDQPEPEFAFDARGEVAAIHARTQTESHRLIEQLMIAANEAVARLLAERRTPCLYRVHERPEVGSVERLVDQLASLGVPTPPLPAGMSRTQAAALMGEISRRVEQHVRRLAARARAGDRAAAPSGGRLALTSLVLRSLQQAYYSPRNIGHAGLGSACYCHFTSPIRRYPDIVCHRALLSAIGAGERAPRAGGLAKLGEWTSERERAAMVIERDADDVARCFALEAQLLKGGEDHTFSGEVIGLISAGAFIAFGHEAGEDTAAGMPPYEGMLPVRHMTPPAAAAAGAGPERDWWDLNEQGTILHGERSGATVRLGDPLAVRVRRVDASRGRVDLVRAGAPTVNAAPAEPPRGSAPPNNKRRGKHLRSNDGQG
jgi:ribonuclease R